MRWLLLALLLVGWPARAEIPSCRFLSPQHPLIEQVRDAARLAVQHYARREGFAFTSVAVNTPPQTPSTLLVEVVLQNAPKGCVARNPSPSDEEAYNLLGVCEVGSQTPRQVRCSAEALLALTQPDTERQVASPALLYVLGHELGHIALGHQGALLDAEQVLEPNMTREEKLATLLNGCGRQTEQFQAELKADEESFALLVDVLVRKPYRDGLVDAGASLALSAGQMRTSALALSEHTRRASVSRGASLPEFITDAPLPASETYTAWATERLLCDALGKTKQRLALPLRSGTHPDSATRLARMTQTLDKHARLQPGETVAPESPLPQPANDLLRDMGPILAKLDEEYAAFVSAFMERLCVRARELESGETPTCRQIGRKPPPEAPRCEGINATLVERRFTPTPVPVQLKAEGPGYLVTGTASAIAVSPRGEVLLGLNEPRHVLHWVEETRVQAWEVPCEPLAGGVIFPEGGALLCRQPASLLKLQGQTGSLLEIRNVVSAGEPTSSEALNIQWLGEVEGQLVASLSAPSGLGIDAVFREGRLEPFGPWTGPSCRELHTGMVLHRHPGQKGWAGIPSSPLATLEVPLFDESLGRIQGIHDSDLVTDTPIRACGPSALHKAIVCLDVEGQLLQLRQGKQPKPLGRMDISSDWKGIGMHAGAQLCGTPKALYVLLRYETPDGGATATMHEVTPSARSGRPVFTRSGAGSAHLACNGPAAAAYVSGEEQSFVWRLRP